MQGLIHRASIYRRATSGSSTQWESTPFITNYALRIDAVSPATRLREKYASCSHQSTGEYNANITQGMRMRVTSGPFYTGMWLFINGADALLGPTTGRSHTELMLTETKENLP